MTTIDPHALGAQHLLTTVQRILANDPADLPTNDDLKLAVGWGVAIVQESMDQGDPVAQTRMELAALILGGASMADVGRAHMYLMEVLETAAQPSAPANPLSAVPPPPPLIPQPAAQPATPKPSPPKKPVRAPR